MELKIGLFRAYSAKQLDELLATGDKIIIIVGKYPRFVVSKYDSVKPKVEVKQKPEGELIEDTILDKDSFLNHTEKKYRVRL